MEFPSEIVRQIQVRLAEAQELYPAALSADRKSLLVDGGIGYGCYVSPDGDVFMETYEVSSDAPPLIDRSRGAQITVLVRGSRTLPELAELLPERQPEAPSCAECGGSGRLHQEAFGGKGFLCLECCGLGWVELS